MIFVCLAQINHRQRCEDKGLQRDHQNVEDRPGHVQRPLHPERQNRDKNEHYLTGVHVTKQTQCKTQRLGQQAQDFQYQVKGYQRSVVERCEGQFLGEAASTFYLDAVEDDQQEHTDGDTEGTIGIGGRYNLEVFKTQRVGNLGDKVHRNQLQAVHQEDPDKHGQGQRRDDRVPAVEAITNDGLNKFDGNFDHVLEPGGHAAGGPLGNHTENGQEQDAHKDGPAQGVHVERHEAHIGCFGRSTRKRPGGLLQHGDIIGVGIDPLITGGELAVSEVLKVVLYIFYWGISCHTALTSSL